MPHHVLVVEDDPAIRGSLTTALELNGYTVSTAPDGIAALQALKGDGAPVDLVVLDVGLPGLDGLGVCRLMRSEAMLTPVLMLTARTTTADRVAGLDAGADDYVAKPFELDELLARLRALLRRVVPANGDAARPGATAPDGALVAGGVRLDPEGRRVWADDAEVALTRLEFDLLELLLRNAGVVLPQSRIYDAIWGYDFGPESKNLAVYVSYLRRKLDRPADTLIRTVRGVGYTIRSDARAGDQ